MPQFAQNLARAFGACPHRGHAGEGGVVARCSWIASARRRSSLFLCSLRNLAISS